MEYDPIEIETITSPHEIRQTIYETLREVQYATQPEYKQLWYTIKDKIQQYFDQVNCNTCGYNQKQKDNPFCKRCNIMDNRWYLSEKSAGELASSILNTEITVTQYHKELVNIKERLDKIEKREKEEKKKRDLEEMRNQSGSVYHNNRI